MPVAHAPGGAPSAWVQRWAPLIRPGGRVLDVTCGSGRHLCWLAAQGFALTGVDRDAQALSTLVTLSPAAELLHADLEAAPWPLPGRLFDAVVVTNYLHRPLFPVLLDSLAPGGVLVYETFAHGQQTIGRPARADFLLQPGELLQRCAGLRVVAFEDGFEAAGAASPARFVQRIVAVREAMGDGAADTAPARYALPAGLDAPAR